MTKNKNNKKLALSRRQILGSLGTVGAAGAGAGLGTSALFSDEEGFANNILEAGEFNLKVDWQVDYYNGIDPDPETISDSDTDGDGEPDLVDDPGPIVDLEDVKPGDVIEHTLSLHLFDNPGFVTMDGLLTADSDNGITEPEDQVDGALNNSDGTPDGDLDNHLQCVAWYDGGTDSSDPGNNFPEEITGYDPTQRDAFIEDLIDGDVSFQTNADEFLFQGTLASLMSTLSGGLLLDPGVNGHVANDYPDSYCFQPSETQYIGILCWLPREVPGVDDNIIQSDRLKYELGFNANQCRNNIDNNGRPDQRPTGGVQPLTFEVTEGYGTLDGGPFDLQSDVGFPEDMITSVDTSGDPVEFELDLPQELDKSANDEWSLVFDADDDGTVDFRVVFDDFFYQDWDDEKGEWGPKKKEEEFPDDIDTGVVDGIYIVRVPRDRLSDPFAFAGRLCYGESVAVSGFDASTEPDDIVVPTEELCISLTGTTDPRLELGPGTSGYEHVTFGPDLNCVIEKEVSVIQLCYDFEECRLLSNVAAKSCYKNHIIEAINAKLIKETTPHNALTPAEIARVESLYDEGTSDSGGTVGLTIPLLLRRVQKVTETTITVKFLLCIVILVPCHDPLEGNLPSKQIIDCNGNSACKFRGQESKKDQQEQKARNEWGNGSWKENLHNHEKGHALASCLVCKVLACLVDRTRAKQKPRKQDLIHPLWDPTNSKSPLVQANSMYHGNLNNGQDPEPAAKAAAWDTFDAKARPCLQSVFNAPNRGRAIQSTTECADDIPDFK